jgi:hypothetical protein
LSGMDAAYIERFPYRWAPAIARNLAAARITCQNIVLS